MATAAAAASANPNAKTDPAPSTVEPSIADLQKILASPAGAQPGAGDEPEPGDNEPEPNAGDEPEPGDDKPEPGDGDKPAEGTKLEPGEDDQPELSAEELAAANAANAADPDSKLDKEDEALRKRFTPEQQKAFDRAMQKKARKIIELKTSLQERETALAQKDQQLDELSKLPPTAIAPTADDPLADVETEVELDKRVQNARQLRRWALTHTDGAPVKDGDKEFEITKERVGEILAETEEFLQDHAPRRRELLRLRQSTEAEALTTHPWLKDKNSQGSLAIETTLRQFPQLRTVPQIRLILADSVIGRLTRTKPAAAGPGTGAGHKPIPKAPASPAGGNRPARVPGAAKAADKALQTVATTGRDPNNAALRAILQS